LLGLVLICLILTLVIHGTRAARRWRRESRNVTGLDLTVKGNIESRYSRAVRSFHDVGLSGGRGTA